MAPADKMTDIGTTLMADETITSSLAPDEKDKTAIGGGMSGPQATDKSGKQGTPVLEGSGIAESTISPKFDDTQVLSEYLPNMFSKRTTLVSVILYFIYI